MRIKQIKRSVFAMSATFFLGLLLMSRVQGAESDAKELVLAEGGQAKCVIVAATGLSPSEVTAVKELQKTLKTISGSSDIRVITPEQVSSSSSQTKLVVGNKTVKQLYPEVSLDGLGTDGFILKTIGDSLLVAGGEKRGTMYAAFDLLEKLGCRWWAVGATYIPKKETLTIPPMDAREIPVLEYRDMLYGDRPALSSEENGNQLYIHNKLNGFNYKTNPEELGGRVEFAANLVHTWASLMKPVGDLDGSFKTHPEYWALVNGKNNSGQPCPMNPQVFEIMKANVIKQLTEHPEYAFVVVGQEDNNSYCQCESCKAFAASEETPAAPGLALANKIADVVEQQFPGKWVMAPAYTWSRKPPKNLKPRSNVGITLCSIECDFNRPLAEGSTSKNKAFAEDIIQWGKIAPKLYIWDYTTDFTHYLMPFPNLDAIVPNIKFLVSHGVKGILEQGSSSTAGAEFSKLRMWVMAKALWDPANADGKALISEFLNGYYGPASGSIQKYIDIIHAPGRADPAMSATCYSLLDSAWLTPEIIAESEVVLREAERAVENDPVLLARVRHAHMPILYVLLKRGPQSKTWAATVAKVGALDIVNMAETFARIVQENDIGQFSEGESIKNLVDWIKDYAALAAQSIPVPPELKDVDPKTYRLIQACQMDKRGRWWVRHDGASDGWVSEVVSIAWLVTFQFSPFEDVVPGKKYKVFARIKASDPASDKTAVQCGLYDRIAKKGTTKKLSADAFPDGNFHAIEVGDFTATETPCFFWMSLITTDSPKVFLDCLWLKEIQ
jgi:hypothetical protein